MITLTQFKRICPLASSRRLEVLLDPLLDAMEEFEIDTPLRAAAFVAQLAHESGSFVYFEEIASGRAYDGREDLGNTRAVAIRIAKEHGSTPGPWWKGHGPIQITGFDNHRDCGDDLGLDLLHSPRLLCKPEHGFRAAGWFWDGRDLNYYADKQDFLRITKKINGGTNGLEDRKAYYARAKEELL